MSASATLEAVNEMETTKSNERASGPVSLPGTVERVVLTGFMGSGKTTTGKLLAELLGWEFRDLDHEIERRDGRTVPQIFAESGEEAFRRLEAGALASLCGRRRVVIALGGGAIEELRSRLLLEQTPRTAVVYLQAPLETLLERCAKDEGTARPLLGEAEARFKRRHPLYERVARHKVTTTELAAEAVAEAVVAALRG